ncbi:hypothetical protein M9Y10_018147 [Tritrichomonas musculus]|uniref:Protein kinase domain-containing protein n=1 Tax=Tritrichomonas musculus TaxID=1915356 RepID=A0ABR2GL78_9EUKA
MLNKIFYSFYNKSLSRPTCIRNLGLIAQALKNAQALDIEGHLRLTIDNFLIDPILDIPILTRYGIHRLWLELYGESGKIPTLICPPEMMNEDQSEITFNEKLISIYDSYAFGVLMYEILTKQILNEEEPFDRNLIDANLQGSENLFLKDLIRSSTDTNPKNRPYNPFASYVKTFVTILQKQMKPILLKSYCVSCQANGDSKTEEYITTSINKDL